jgi:hypothetical protein
MVASLHDYVEHYRRHLFRPFAEFSQHKLINELCNLPPLSATTWTQWHQVTWAVLNHFSNGNPTNLPAFAHEPLRRMVTKRTPLVQQLHEGWKALASRMASKIG